jgi:hypothetical protein
MSFLRPYVCNNPAKTGLMFMKFDIWVFFEIFKEIEVSLKSDENNEYFT